jgi:methyl coenzyme M reductase beta subunit
MLFDQTFAFFSDHSPNGFVGGGVFVTRHYRRYISDGFSAPSVVVCGMAD